MSGDPVVIIGASLAGATAALTLRELGYEGDLVLVGAEDELPYERPELSKAYLLGTMSADQLLVRPPETYDELGIQLRLGVAANALDADHGCVLLDHGGALSYASLVIATGAGNIRPPIPGLELPGVHQLRTMADAAALRAAASPGAKAVVVGMGFIGCEIAATLRKLDVDVAAVDGVSGPLINQLGPELSGRVQSWHSEYGVRMLFGRSVSEITPDGSALSVKTTSGDVLPADLVVVGVGVRPVTDWLAESAVHLSGGVGVDDDGRTNIADVYAAGDVAARWDERGREHRRIEHWSNAIEQGRRVAHTILDVAAPPEPAPYFWTAQYDHYLQYVGSHRPGANLITRDVDGRFTGFYVEDGVIRAGVTIDNGKELRHLRGLIGREIDVDTLADSSIGMRELAAGQLA